MLKSLMQLELKAQNWVAQLHFPADATIEALEQMGIQFLQFLGQAKAQNAAAASQQAPAPVVPDAVAAEPAPVVPAEVSLK